MSYAWVQLQSAMRSLAGTGNRRDRLAAAYCKLIKLKAKDLPAEVSDAHIRLLGRVSRFPAKSIAQEVRDEVDALSAEDVTAAIHTIMQMYDAVSAYQPRPIKHPGGRQRRPGAAPDWSISAGGAVKTRQGDLFKEAA